jgi:hypothetical protein
MEEYIDDVSDMMDRMKDLYQMSAPEVQVAIRQIDQLLEEDEAIGDIVGDMDERTTLYFQDQMDDIIPLFEELTTMREKAQEQLNLLRVAAPAAGGRRKRKTKTYRKRHSKRKHTRRA